MVKVLASSFESLPQTLLTRGGVAGIPIMLTSAYQSNMEALVAEGHNPADKMTIINALASAGVEVATSICSARFKGVATGVKTGAKVAGSGAKTAILTGTKGFMDEILGRVAKQAVKPTVWNITKEIILSGAEEGN